MFLLRIKNELISWGLTPSVTSHSQWLFKDMHWEIAFCGFCVSRIGSISSWIMHGKEILNFNQLFFHGVTYHPLNIYKRHMLCKADLLEGKTYWFSCLRCLIYANRIRKIAKKKSSRIAKTIFELIFFNFFLGIIFILPLSCKCRDFMQNILSINVSYFSA